MWFEASAAWSKRQHYSVEHGRLNTETIVRGRPVPAAQASIFFELPQQFQTFAYKIEYSLPSSQKLTLLLSEPKKFQGHRRYPDSQASGKKP